MSNSFNGIPTFPLADDVPRHMQADISIRHIPGSNLSYIDNGGPQLRQVVYNLLFKVGADALTFEAQLGQQGVLVSDVDGTFNAILSDIRRVAHGANVGGEAVIACTFVIL